MDWLSAVLLAIFAREFRILRSKKRLGLLSPAVPGVIGLYLLVRAADDAGEFGTQKRRHADPPGESGLHPFPSRWSRTQPNGQRIDEYGHPLIC
jgi:hypothetical protein